MMKTTEIIILSKTSYPLYLKETATFAGRMDPPHIFQFREEAIYIVQGSKIWLKPVELCNSRTICRISFLQFLLSRLLTENSLLFLKNQRKSLKLEFCKALAYDIISSK